MTNPGESYKGSLPPGVRPIKRRKRETEQAFNLRKARIRKDALEKGKAANEAAFEAEHPSDTPLEKFKRVWNNKDFV